MVTHSPGTPSGLKILVSAVRFCPWPHPLPLGFNQLDPLRSRLSSIFLVCFAITLLVLTLLQYEPEFTKTPARLKCTACGWMLYDPNFRKEKPRYFLTDSVDRRVEWKQEHPGYDLYEPKSAACQLGISVSFLRYSIKHERSAPVMMG